MKKLRMKNSAGAGLYISLEAGAVALELRGFIYESGGWCSCTGALVNV